MRREEAAKILARKLLLTPMPRLAIMAVLKAKVLGKMP